MKQHYVEFYSPGTFMSESSMKEIESWDTAKALKMAKDIVERHGAKPYAFRFLTRGRGPNDLDSKVTDSSALYFFGIKVTTYNEILKRNLPDEAILRSNMELNNISRIAESLSGWKIAIPIGDKDTVL